MARTVDPTQYAQYRILLAEEPEISVNAAAKRIGVNERTLRRWIESPPEGWENAQSRLKASPNVQLVETVKAQNTARIGSLKRTDPSIPAETQELFRLIETGLVPDTLRLRLNTLKVLNEAMEGIDELKDEKDKFWARIQWVKVANELYGSLRADGVPDIIAVRLTRWIEERESDMGAIMELCLVLAGGRYGADPDFQDVKTMMIQRLGAKQ